MFGSTKKIALIALSIPVLCCTVIAVLSPPVYKLCWKQIERDYDWIEFNEISRYSIFATLTAEDTRFFSHHGVDFREIIASIRENFAAGSYKRGASTITQQVVRMAFLSPKKTLLRKLREVCGAIVLELVSNKEEILQWYFSLAPFGNGIRGLRNAAKYYFDTEPQLLNVSQSIHLALLLPRPSSRAKFLLRRKLPKAMQRRFANIARSLLNQRHISRQQYLQVLATGNFGAQIELRSPTPRERP